MAASTDIGAPERFMRAVAAFRQWAETVTGRYGEWECDYPSWTDIHLTFRALVAAGDVEQWPHELVRTALYAIARDNEDEVLADDLPRGALRFITEHALVESEPQARWQLAAALGRAALPSHEALLLRLIDDEDEYVRRRALGALAQIGSSAVTDLALREWARTPDDAPWMRMMALEALRQVRSSAYAEKLAEARASTNELLAGFAAKLAAEPD